MVPLMASLLLLACAALPAARAARALGAACGGARDAAATLGAPGAGGGRRLAGESDTGRRERNPLFDIGRGPIIPRLALPEAPDLAPPEDPFSVTALAATVEAAAAPVADAAGTGPGGGGGGGGG